MAGAVVTIALFLDIDGVLNSVGYVYSRRPVGFGPKHMIDPEAVAVLNQIVERWHPNIVLSSTWRRSGRESIQRLLAEQGFIGELADVTPPDVDGRHRHEDIKLWLDTNPRAWDRYVVIDDDPMAWSNAGYADRGFYLATHFSLGLVPEHLPLLARWLEGPIE